MDSAIDPTSAAGRDEKSESAKEYNEQQLPSLEDEVKQLAGSISSWWSNFSKQSQQQINDVRAQVDAQGGLMSIAKREAARFEAQLSEAQESARKSVKASTDEEGNERRKRMSVDLDGWGTVGAVGGEDNEGSDARKSKGKGKLVEEENVGDGDGDDGAAVERLEERTRERSGAQQRSSVDRRGVDEGKGGEALFDADSAEDEGPASEFKVIEDAAQTAMHSMQSFWGRIQTDERMTKLQTSVAKTLQSITVPTTNPSDGKQSVDKAGDENSATSALPDLTKQFQNAFPTLDWKESQTMAKRYFEASQSAARDLGKEMTSFMGDLVQVVPAPTAEEREVGKDGVKQSTTQSTSLHASPSKPSASSMAVESSSGAHAMLETDEDDFDWDNEVGGAGLETTTGPQTSSWDDADPHIHNVQTVSEAEEASTKAALKGKVEEEDEEDSDWE